MWRRRLGRGAGAKPFLGGSAGDAYDARRYPQYERRREFDRRYYEQRQLDERREYRRHYRQWEYDDGTTDADRHYERRFSRPNDPTGDDN